MKPRSNIASITSSSSPISSSRDRSCPAARALRTASAAATFWSRVMLAQPGRHSGRPSSSSVTPARPAELAQPLAVEPLDPVALLVSLEQDDRGHCVGIEQRRQLEVRVELRRRREVQPGCLLRGLGLGGLRDDPYRSAARTGPVEHRQHLVADGAVVLDEGEQLHQLERPFATSPLACSSHSL